MNPSTSVAIPETADLGSRVKALVPQISITNSLEHEQALTTLKAIAALRSDIEIRFAATKKLAHTLHKEVCNLEKGFLDPCDKADRAIRAEVVKYEDTVRKSQESAKRVTQFVESNPEMADLVQVPEVQTTAEVSGVTSRDNWKAEVIDFHALVRFVAGAGEEYMTLLMPNESALNKLSKALDGKIKIPGVRPFNDRGLTVRK